MLLIVGHGPSLNLGLGDVIDSHTVVSLKNGIPKGAPAALFGSRTDYICGRSEVYRPEDGTPFWFFRDDSPWYGYYAGFRPRHRKPSHGLSAVFCAIDELDPPAIALIGFDRVLRPNDQHSRKWHDVNPPQSLWGHDQRAEYECLHSLGVEIIDLAKVYGEVPRV